MLINLIKIKKGYVIVSTVKLTDLVGNALDVMGMGNNDAVGKNYETMVFSSNKGGNVKSWRDIDKANYLTELEAKKGHNKMVKKWKNK